MLVNYFVDSKHIKIQIDDTQRLRSVEKVAKKKKKKEKRTCNGFEAFEAMS